MRTAALAHAPGGTLYRVVVPGARLRLLVLAADGGGDGGGDIGGCVGGCVGVDLDTGAFVRAAHPAGADPPGAFEVVEGEIAGAVEPPDPARPEALELAAPPRPVGRLSVRRADRLLAPLHHPPRLPLLGLAADAVPYWTLSGDSPSLALVDLRADARLRAGESGAECHFNWQGVDHDLPFTDGRLLAAIERQFTIRPTRGDVQRLLGYRPRRLLVLLTAPIDGYCHKTVAALLPGGRG